MKKLLYLSIILLLASFKEPKIFTGETNNCFNTIVEKYRVNLVNQVLEKKQNIDSIFIVKGLPLDINGIKCYWEYKVKKVKHAPVNELNITIIYQKLVTLNTKKTLFETGNEVDSEDKFYSFENFKNYKTLNIECNDINNDGYCDFKIVIERAAAGANETSEIFLFNPKHKKFELSKVFSGTNMEYDKDKNRISFMWKMSVQEYNYGFINLKKNKKDIEFTEDVYQNLDTIIYTKCIGKKIIKRKKVVNKREDWQGNEVEVGAFEYLLERNKK